MPKPHRGARESRRPPHRRSPAQAEPNVAERPWVALICIALVLATGLVYAQLRRFAFLSFDDNAYIYDNPHVRTGLKPENIAWAFTAFHSNNWHPLTWISHMLDCQLLGLDPGLHHLMNVGLHALNGVVLFLLLRSMTGTLWRSAFVAAAFTLHPLRVESVAWASERKDVLSALFALLTIGAYAAYALRPGALRYAAVLALFALGLLSKPMLVTLPFVLLLLDYWPLRRFERSDPARASLPWLDKLPLLLLAAASSILTVVAQSRGGIVQSLSAIPLSMRLANALVSLVHYALELLLPLRQAFYYPYPSKVPTLAAGVALVVLIGATIACWRARRERPYALVGWLWYLGMLVPVIGLVQVATQAMADRYTYLPSIGLWIAITWAIADVMRVRPAWRVPVAVGAVLAVCTFALLSRSRARYWKDDHTLFARDTLVVKDNALAFRGLGVALGGEGRYTEALPLFQRTLAYYPHDALTLYDIAGTLDKLGRLPEAAETYRASIRYAPEWAESRFRLADVLSRMGREPEAIPELREAVRLRPEFVDAHYKLGKLLARRDDYPAAIASFRNALRLDPAHVASHNDLGIALQQAGQSDAALAELETALRIDPRFVPAEINLSMVYMMRGDTAEVRRHLARAMELNPELAKKLAQDLGERLREAGSR